MFLYFLDVCQCRKSWRCRGCSHISSKIVWTKLVRLGQIWLNLGKIEAKFGQKRLDLGKIKILHPKKYSISYDCDVFLQMYCIAVLYLVCSFNPRRISLLQK